MADSLPIFDEMGRLFGTVVYDIQDGRKRIFFRQRDSTMIDLSDMQKFTSFLKKSEIPEEEASRAIRFFNEKMFSLSQ